MSDERESWIGWSEMKTVGFRVIATVAFFLSSTAFVLSAESAKSDKGTTAAVRVRLALDQRAMVNEDGWFLVPVGTINLRAESDAPVRLVQFYAIKLKAGEVPRRIRDDADAQDGFTAQFRTDEAAAWNFWADAYTLKNERFVTNTLRVMTQIQETPTEKPLQ
jgi:hypothetical protein